MGKIDQQKAYIIDTHALFWLFDDNKKLGKKSLELLSNRTPDYIIVIPIIVLVELKYLIAKGKFKTSYNDVFQNIAARDYIEIAQFDDYMLKFLSDKLNIHDSMIIATALFYRDFIGFDVNVITKDQEITNSKLVEIVW